MGTTYKMYMQFNDCEIGEKLISCNFKQGNKWYVDLAMLAGIRENFPVCEEDKKLTEEELEYMSSILQTKANSRCVFARVSRLKEGGYLLVTEKWNDYPMRLVEYVSKRTQEVMYETEVYWDTWIEDDPGYETLFVKNGECFSVDEPEEANGADEENTSSSEAKIEEEPI